MSHDGFIAHCLELLAPLGPVRARRMFDADRLYLKADADSAAQFAAAGGQPFTYPRSGKTAMLGFWTVPAEALESPEGMRPWGSLAMQAAVQARHPRRPPRSAARKPR
jgi:DNA transformation protein